jgi:hypothetical protein
MAQLILKGSFATIELTSDPEDSQTVATCIEHQPSPTGWPEKGCDWTEHYDTLDDAAEYAAGHADRGTR